MGSSPIVSTLFCLGVSGTDEPSDGIPRAGLVVAGWVEGEVSELFAVGGDDSDVEVADEDEYSSTAVSSADPDVVKAGAVAESDAAGGVDFVVADFGVREDRLAFDDRGGFVEGGHPPEAWRTPL